MAEGEPAAGLRHFATHRVGSDYVLVDGESGAWLVVDEEARRALEPLSGEPCTVAELRRRLGADLAGVLLESGLALTDENRGQWSGFPRWEDPEQIFVVLHLTDRCCFSCVYCYADSESRRPGRYMSEDVLNRTVRLLVDSDYRRITLGLHGGEPMLWLRKNLKVLESALGVLKSAGKRVHMHTQTSGAVLHEDSLRFVKEHSIAVGVSCDGPPGLNDVYRKRPSGRGTSSQIEAFFDALRLREIPFGAICSVGARSVGQAKAIVDYFREQGIRRVRFNPVWDYPRACAAGAALDEAGYFEFYLELMDLLRRQNGRDTPPVMSMDLGWMLKNLRSRDRSFMCLRSPCGAGGNPMLAVDPRGNLFPCEKMIALPQHRAGNILDERTLEGVAELPAMARVRGRTVQAIAECSTCDWRAFCGGGCPADVTAMGRDLLEPDPNCHYYRRIFKTLMVRLVEDDAFLDRVCPPEIRGRPVGRARDRPSNSGEGVGDAG